VQVNLFENLTKSTAGDTGGSMHPIGTPFVTDAEIFNRKACSVTEVIPMLKCQCWSVFAWEWHTPTNRRHTVSAAE